MQVFVRAIDELVKVYVDLDMFDEAVNLVLLLLQKKGFGFVLSLSTCNFVINCLIGYVKLDMSVAIYERFKMRVFGDKEDEVFISMRES
ncbi:hypothetical protein Sjap_018428 [Stephania japonica]|uniref:Uncharacterized protein n=1 Tax=Stephania japonica TaxID=461633 RepID=A0AAP0I805_9MAGN